MSVQGEIGPQTVRAVAKAIRDYAKGIYLDPYGDQREYERDSHLRDHLILLASHLEAAV